MCIIYIGIWNLHCEIVDYFNLKLSLQVCWLFLFKIHTASLLASFYWNTCNKPEKKWVFFCDFFRFDGWNVPTVWYYYYYIFLLRFFVITIWLWVSKANVNLCLLYFFFRDMAERTILGTTSSWCLELYRLLLDKKYWRAAFYKERPDHELYT
jgi:hypothetical protein